MELATLNPPIHLVFDLSIWLPRGRAAEEEQASLATGLPEEVYPSTAVVEEDPSQEMNPQRGAAIDQLRLLASSRPIDSPPPGRG